MAFETGRNQEMPYFLPPTSLCSPASRESGLYGIKCFCPRNVFYLHFLAWSQISFPHSCWNSLNSSWQTEFQSLSGLLTQAEKELLCVLTQPSIEAAPHLSREMPGPYWKRQHFSLSKSPLKHSPFVQLQQLNLPPLKEHFPLQLQWR